MARLLEVCVDSLASARAAINGGADRIELCSALPLGGLTPYTTLLQQIRKISDIPIRCLIRPRAGDFLYSHDEIDLMIMQIKELKASGSNGFVIGCLKKDGSLDEYTTQKMIEAADGTDLTLHRCIDVSLSPVDTYRMASNLGFDAVLTSGAASNCVAGLETIKKLLALRDTENGPEVLIGAGISPLNIRRILSKLPNARAFHASCKMDLESRMVFRRREVPMGLPGLDEWHIQQTSEKDVRELKSLIY